jgi:hypothetical protein
MKVGDKVSIKDVKSDLYNRQGEVIGFEEQCNQAKAIVMVEHYVFRSRIQLKNCIVDRFDPDKLQQVMSKRKAS